MTKPAHRPRLAPKAVFINGPSMTLVWAGSKCWTVAQWERAEKRRAWTREWAAEPNVHERRRLHRQLPEVQERRREWAKEYRSRPEVQEKIKAYRAEYNQRPEVKRAQADYQHNWRAARKLDSYPRSAFERDIDGPHTSGGPVEYIPPR